MNKPDIDFDLDKIPKHKKKFKVYVLIVVLLGLAAGGIWAGKEFLQKGEVVIPVPDTVAKVVKDHPDLVDSGRLGPIRLGDGSTGEGGPGSDPSGEPQGGDAQAGDSGRVRPNIAGVDAPDGTDQTGVILGPDGKAVAFKEPKRESSRPGSGKTAPALGADGLPVDADSASRTLAMTSGARKKITQGEDQVMPMDFVRDLASYLAANYWPQGTHPAAGTRAISTASAKAVNQRYGIDLIGFAGATLPERDRFRDRALILDYVFTPDMLQALGRLYVDRFADELARAGQREATSKTSRRGALSKQQTVDMLNYYERDARALAAALRSYASSPRAATLVDIYVKAEKEAHDAQYNFQEAHLGMEVATETGSQSRIRAAQRELAKAESNYQQALRVKTRAEVDVVQMMTEQGAKGDDWRLEAGNLLYLASWCHRRGPGSSASLLSSASSAELVGQVLREKAASLK